MVKVLSCDGDYYGEYDGGDCEGDDGVVTVAMMRMRGSLFVVF